MEYLTLDLAIAAHQEILDMSGGRPGLSAEGMGRLDSILTLVRDDDYYPEFVDKLTYLVYSVNKGHCFADGNKRTSIALGCALMSVNNYFQHRIQRFIEEMEEVAVHIADNRVERPLLLKIIASICSGEEELSDALKLEVIYAIKR